MKNRGLIITIIILIICVLGLSGYIVYDKVLNKNAVNNEQMIDEQTNNNNNEQLNDSQINNNDDVSNKNNSLNMNVNVNSPLEFIDKIDDTENVLENGSKYEVSFNDFKFTVSRNEIAKSNFDNIIITYKDKMINKNRVIYDGDPGYHTLDSYYFNKDAGLYILTFLPAPQPAIGAIAIIAFDNNGNILKDESVLGSIDVNQKNLTLLYDVRHLPGETCFSSNMDSMEIASETILYEYVNDSLEVKNKETVLVKDLPECDW